ncbi:MAG: hypothetical protein V4543_05740 [Bacteroidota bacterium]
MGNGKTSVWVSGYSNLLKFSINNKAGEGCLYLSLPAGWQLKSAQANVSTGNVNIVASNKRGVSTGIKLLHASSADLLWVTLPPALSGRISIFNFQPVNNSVFATKLSNNGEITCFENAGKTRSGLSICARQKNNIITIASAAGSKANSEAVLAKDSPELKSATAEYHKFFSETAAGIATPDYFLQNTWNHMLWSLANYSFPNEAVVAQNSADLISIGDTAFTKQISAFYGPTGSYKDQLPYWVNGTAVNTNRSSQAAYYWNSNNDLLLTKDTPEATVYKALLAWKYFSATQDTAFLRKTCYPLLKAAVTESSDNNSEAIKPAIIRVKRSYLTAASLLKIVPITTPGINTANEPKKQVGQDAALIKYKPASGLLADAEKLILEGSPDAGYALLRFWMQNFINEVGQPLINTPYTGFAGTAYIADTIAVPDPVAEFVFASALHSMFITWSGDTLVPAPALPHGLKNLHYTNFATEGGFLLNALYKNGKCDQLKILSPYGGRLKVKLNLGEKWLANDTLQTGCYFMADTRPGDEILLETFRIKKKPVIDWSPNKRKARREDDEADVN